MREDFRRLFDSLAFRALLVSTLFIVSVFFVVQPNIHGDFSKYDHSKATPTSENIEQAKIFFGLSPEGWTAVFTCGLFVATIALFIATYALFSIAARESDKADQALKVARLNADAATRSADTARATLIASNRAWLQGEMILGNQPLTFLNGSVQTTVGFRFSNTGNAPAQKISFDAWLLAHERNGRITVRERHELRCLEAKLDGRSGLEFSLFPGEAFPQIAGFTNMFVGAVMSQQNFERTVLSRSPEGDFMPIFVGGCINYTFTSDSNSMHQTSFLHELGTNTLQPTIPVGKGNIPANNLRLVSLSLGDGRNAD